jgi:hypothetical protein
MNRMALIAVAVCAVLLATVGAGTAAAPQKVLPQYRVVQYDVTYNTEIVGKLSVNTNQWTYVLNAHGLEPGTKYYFYCLGNFPQINKGTANEDGDLHLSGAYPPNIGVENPNLLHKFVLTDGPLTGSVCTDSQLTAKYHPGLLKTTVWGYLKNLDGTPLPNQWVYVYACSPNFCDWLFPSQGLVPTDANGRFEVSGKTGGTMSLDIEILYEYGYANGQSYCEKWAKAQYSATGPL